MLLKICEFFFCFADYSKHPKVENSTFQKSFKDTDTDYYKLQKFVIFVLETVTALQAQEAAVLTLTRLYPPVAQPGRELYYEYFISYLENQCIRTARSTAKITCPVVLRHYLYEIFHYISWIVRTKLSKSIYKYQLLF